MSDTTIATLETIIGADSSNFDKATDGVRSRLEGLAKVAGGVVSIVAGVFAAGAIITATGNYDEAIKNIQSVTGATAVQTSALSSELLKVGSGAVAGPQAVANAYYDIAGGVADASVRMATLNAAIATSEAGNADLGATTQGLISVMNAYQMSASEAGFASDVFTRTVGMGVGSMDAFVAAISPMSGLAAKSGIGFDELGSMLAYMTTQGSSASQSATQLKGVITAFLSPNKSMAAALKKAGLESGSAAIENLGLAGALDAVKAAMGGSTDAMAVALGSVEALQGATSLTGGGFTEFAKTFSDGLDGVTESARKVQLESFNAQWAKFNNMLAGMAIQIGTMVLPILNQLVGFLTGVLGGLDIGAVLGTLINGLDSWLKPLGGIQGAISKIWDGGLKPLFDKLITGVKGFADGIGKADTSGLQKLLMILAGAAFILGTVFKGALDGLISALPQFGEGIGKLVSSLAAFANGDISTGLSLFAFGIKDIADGLLKIPLNAAQSLMDLFGIKINVADSLSSWTNLFQVQIPAVLDGVFGPGKLIDQKLAPLRDTWNNLFGDGKDSLKTQVSASLAGVGQFFTELFSDKGAVGTAFNAGKALIDDVIAKVSSIAGAIGSAFKSVIDIVTMPFRQVIFRIGKMLIEAAKYGGMFENLLGPGGALVAASGLNNAGEMGAEGPKFASGGYTGNMSPSSAAGTVHGQEYVVPKGGALVMSGGGGNTNITLNVYGQTDANRLVDMIDAELRRRNRK